MEHTMWMALKALQEYFALLEDCDYILFFLILTKQACDKFLYFN